MIYLRNSTTSQEVALGPFVSSTDGNTETAPSLTSDSVYVWRAGQTSVITVTAGAVALTGGSAGMYYTVLDEAHTGVNGSGSIFVHPSGSLPIRVHFTVLPQQVYDSMISGTDLLQTDTVQWNNTSVSVSYLMPVTVRVWDQTSVSSSNVAVQDFSTRLNANVQQWVGVSVTSNNVAIWQSISTANVTAWNGKSTSTSDLAAFSVSQTVLTSATVAGAVNVDRIAGVTISASILTSLGTMRVFKSDIVAKAGVSVTASTLFPVVVRVWDTVSVSASNVAVADFSTRLNVNVQQWAGKSTSSSDLAAFSVSQTVLTSASIAGSVDVGSWAGVSVSTNQIAVRTTLAKGTEITGFNDISQQTVSSVMFSTQMAEGYAITTSAMTLPQAVYSLWSFLTQFGIAGTTYTSKKLDKATTAMTFSLDSAVTPSAITRET